MIFVSPSTHLEKVTPIAKSVLAAPDGRNGWSENFAGLEWTHLRGGRTLTVRAVREH
jgi:hypothetical protein